LKRVICLSKRASNEIPNRRYKPPSNNRKAVKPYMKETIPFVPDNPSNK
jgi:hypothetical protein